MSVDFNFKIHDGKFPFLNLTYKMWDKNNNNIAKLSPSEAGLHTSASSMSLNRDWYNYSQITATRFQAWVQNIKLLLLEFISPSKSTWKKTRFSSNFWVFCFYMEFKIYSLIFNIYWINGNNCHNLGQFNSTLGWCYYR